MGTIKTAKDAMGYTATPVRHVECRNCKRCEINSDGRYGYKTSYFCTKGGFYVAAKGRCFDFLDRGF